jgi:hypothetical protein
VQRRVLALVREDVERVAAGGAEQRRDRNAPAVRNSQRAAVRVHRGIGPRHHRDRERDEQRDERE